MARQMASDKPEPPPLGGRPGRRMLGALADAIDALNRSIGHAVAWLALAMVLVQAALVIGRYVFGIGSIAVQESVLYMHGLLFTLAAAFALVSDSHVRVDILYRRARRRTRAAIDLAGALGLLLPFMAAIAWTGWPYVVESWRTLEGSRETSGLAFVYLVKTAILAMAGLVALQGVAMAIRALLALTDRRAAGNDAIS